MKHKYLYLSLIIIVVASITYYDYDKVNRATQFWGNNADACVAGQGCSLPEVRPGWEVGDTLENVNLYTVDGQVVKLYDLVQGKKNIYINLTTDWCTDCQEEQKELREIIPNLDEETIVIPVFISFRSDKTNVNQLKQYIKDQEFPFTSYVDENNTFLKHFKVNGTPTNIYVNHQGRIKIIGQEVSIKEMMVLENKE